MIGLAPLASTSKEAVAAGDSPHKAVLGPEQRECIDIHVVEIHKRGRPFFGWYCYPDQFAIYSENSIRHERFFMTVEFVIVLPEHANRILALLDKMAAMCADIWTHD